MELTKLLPIPQYPLKRYTGRSKLTQSTPNTRARRGCNPQCSKVIHLSGLPIKPLHPYAHRTQTGRSLLPTWFAPVAPELIGIQKYPITGVTLLTDQNISLSGDPVSNPNPSHRPKWLIVYQ
jgi:hypothetical protein